MALEQQTATSELLKRDRPVARSTCSRSSTRWSRTRVRLCEAAARVVFRFDGELLRVVAAHNVTPERGPSGERASHCRPGAAAAAARAALERRTVHIPDVLADPEYSSRRRRASIGFRSVLAVPMLRDGELARRDRRLRGTRSGRSPTTRSRCWRPSPTRRSSPSRTCGCFTELQTQERRPHRGPGAADGDQRDPARHHAARRPTSSRCSTRSSGARVRLCDAAVRRAVSRSTAS